MSDWKLRRLIQEGIFPVVQDLEGGPFLLDLRDLDGYIESHKHSIAEDFPSAAKFPVISGSGHARNRARGKRNETTTRDRKNLSAEEQQRLVDQILPKRCALSGIYRDLRQAQGNSCPESSLGRGNYWQICRTTG